MSPLDTQKKKDQEKKHTLKTEYEDHLNLTEKKILIFSHLVAIQSLYHIQYYGIIDFILRTLPK
jgi:abortive infection bacteriophage resistance protein